MLQIHLDRQFVGEGEIQGDICAGLHGAAERVNSRLPAHQQIGEQDSLSYEDVDKKWKLLNKWVEEEALKIMVDDAIGSVFDSARLKSIQAKSAGAF